MSETWVSLSSSTSMRSKGDLLAPLAADRIARSRSRTASSPVISRPSAVADDVLMILRRDAGARVEDVAEDLLAGAALDGRQVGADLDATAAGLVAGLQSFLNVTAPFAGSPSRSRAGFVFSKSFGSSLRVAALKTAFAVAATARSGVPIRRLAARVEGVAGTLPAASSRAAGGVDRCGRGRPRRLSPARPESGRAALRSTHGRLRARTARPGREGGPLHRLGDPRSEQLSERRDDLGRVDRPQRIDRPETLRDRAIVGKGRRRLLLDPRPRARRGRGHGPGLRPQLLPLGLPSPIGGLQHARAARGPPGCRVPSGRGA